MLNCRKVANEIRSGKLKAESVMRGVLTAAEAAHTATNCVVQLMGEESLRQAILLDERIAAGEWFDEERYPLLGIPVSVKDMLDVEGADTLGGSTERQGSPAPRDSHVVLLLRRCGAIPFCKTNVPQLIWTAESSNPVVGCTRNPVNPNFTSGGSSGGEAALIALGGSMLGVGSDLGGSLRIPAHFSGVYSLRPTSGRIPTFGHLEYVGGQEAIPLVVGPMSNSIANLELFMEAVIGKCPWELDPRIAPVSFRRQQLQPKLRIGFYSNDGSMGASPACVRALEICTAALKRKGHLVAPFNPPRVPDAMAIYVAIANADAMAATKRLLSKVDQQEDNCSQYLRVLDMPTFVKKCISFMLDVFGQPTAARFVRALCPKSADEVWQLQEQARRYQSHFQQEWANMRHVFDGEMDAIICPVTALPAHPHNHNMQASPSYSYTMLYNLLDYPAGVIPVTTVDSKQDATPLHSQAPHTNDRLLQSHAAQLYDAKAMHGLPVGIQVVSRRYNDEQVLQIMQLVDSLIH